MILVTGGAGYIGSHTVVELLTAGYDVIVIDNFSNSRKEIVNAISQITGKDFVFYNDDVNNIATLDQIFSSYKIDAVIHFAGYKAVGESVLHPIKYYRNNIDTTLSLLEAMQKNKVNKFIFSSSATVYGTPDFVPIPETATTGKCTNPYGKTKYFVENIIQDCSIAYTQMSFVLLRYFNPIGAHKSGLIGELPNGIPNNLMPYVTKVAAGKLPQLNIFGNDYPTRDGTGVRDYIHVIDLAKGHIAAMQYANTHEGVEVFNLGTGKGYSVLEVVKTFERCTGKTVPYQFAPRRAGDVAACWADPQKANSVLGWKPENDLDDMCRDAWRWEQNLANQALLK